MREDDAKLDELVEAMLDYLDLPKDEAYRPGICLNLKAAQAIAAPVLAFDLDDEAEPAPVFSA